MTKGIIFDFGGVFNNAHESMTGFTGIAERFGYTPETFYDLLYHGPSWQSAKLGRMTTEAYWREIMNILGLDPVGEVAAFRSELFAGEKIDPDVVAIAEQLSQRFPLALLSNATDELEWVLEHRFGIRHLFQVVVNSATAGVAKPEPAAYHLALNGLRLHPEEVVFIDDKPRNIVAAEALGIPSILFTDAVALTQELRDRRLLP